jgi:Flp pilus assembly protein TadB
VVEVVLAALLAIASAVGALFWRKASQAQTQARRVVDEARDEARDENTLREATIVANVDAIDDRLAEVNDDRDGRQELADMLND